MVRYETSKEQNNRQFCTFHFFPFIKNHSFLLLLLKEVGKKITVKFYFKGPLFSSYYNKIVNIRQWIHVYIYKDGQKAERRTYFGYAVSIQKFSQVT